MRSAYFCNAHASFALTCSPTSVQERGEQEEDEEEEEEEDGVVAAVGEEGEEGVSAQEMSRESNFVAEVCESRESWAV